MTRKLKSVLAIALCALGFSASAQVLPTPDYSGDIASRSTLTGDWGGNRGKWASQGFHLNLDTTVTYQNAFSGGFDEADEILGSTALSIHLDTGKAGWWPGGLISIRAEGRYGDGVQRDVGAISPVSADILAPIDADELGTDDLALTELTMIQFLSEKVGFIAGLLNTEEGDANELAGSLRDNSRFLNTSFRMSLSEGISTPNVTLGVGIILLPTPNIQGSIVAYDTEESAGSDPFDTDDGTSIGTEWQFSYEMNARPGKQTLGFIYAFDNEFTAFGQDRRGLLRALLPGQTLATEDESWVFYYNGHQYVQWNNGRGWGVFGRFSITDGDANPVDWTMAAGLGGTGLLNSRPHDTWGIGYYHLDLVTDGALFNLLDIDNEDGFEIFYNAELTPWFHLTADLQVIDTAIGQPAGGLVPLIGPGGLLPVAPRLGSINDSDTAWVFGLRAHVEF